MDENETLSGAFDKLSEMLSSEEGQKQISDILGMLSSGVGEGNTDTPKEAPEKKTEEKPKKRTAS